MDSWPIEGPISSLVIFSLQEIMSNLGIVVIDYLAQKLLVTYGTQPQLRKM